MKEGSTRQAFRLKVEAIEAAVRDGVIPTEIPNLRRIQDVRDWDSPPFKSWVSYSVAAPNGPNADLRKRLDRVFPTFVERQSGAVRKGVRAPAGADSSEWLASKERDALLVQNAELLASISQLETRLRVSEAERHALRQNVAELQATLNKVRGLRAV